jgi:hypothetical protein
VSGLETAIRSALDKSDRANGQARAKIYQSARQALDAGLRRQGVTDALVIMQQQKRLEDKIREIEAEEVERLMREVSAAQDMRAEAPMSAAVSGDTRRRAPSPQIPPTAQQVTHPEQAPVEPVLRSVPHPVPVSSDLGPSLDHPAAGARAFHDDPAETSGDPVMPEDVALGGETRTVAADAGPAISIEADRPQSMRADAPAVAVPMAEPETRGRKASGRVSRSEQKAIDKAARKAAKSGKRSRSGSASPTGLDVPPERAAKPRKRRGFLSHLVTWLVTLMIVAGGCWWFYTSGMVQSVIQDAMKAGSRGGADGGDGSHFDPRGGFSDAWNEIFKPADVANARPAARATAVAATGSEGPAVRIASADTGPAGDIAFTVPADLLREMAGKSSTIAVEVQSGLNQGVPFSVSCDFGSLGNCARHRFTATQEKQEALFRVTFDRTLAPNAPGRLVINAGLGGAGTSVLLYSIRILPGQ